MTAPSLPERPEPPPAPRSVSSEELFQGQRMACIHHDGKVYRLLLTRNNKLILQR
ncbi:hemin uptake protein HemP [Lacipirellula sp.]|uniref:hemin uptake protein HemP n=1 Tax=Lacipirellula sp. TaxID=2691419 RepID=UPI003D14E12F